MDSVEFLQLKKHFDNLSSDHKISKCLNLYTTLATYTHFALTHTHKCTYHSQQQYKLCFLLITNSRDEKHSNESDEIRSKECDRQTHIEHIPLSNNLDGFVLKLNQQNRICTRQKENKRRK